MSPTSYNIWGRGDGDVYRFGDGVESGMTGWFGDQPVIVVGDVLRLLGFWLLGFFGSVSASVTAFTVPVEYGAIAAVVSAVIKTLFALGVNKFFERKVGVCLRGLGREWGCGIERPGWLNALAVLGSDVALRGFLVLFVKSCMEMYLKDVLKRRKTHVLVYALTLHMISFLVGLIPGGGIISAVGAATSVIMYAVHWNSSPGVVYLWIPLASVACGVGGNFLCGLFPVVCVLAKAVPEVIPPAPVQCLSGLGAAILGDVYIPGLQVEVVNSFTSVYEENSVTREALMSSAYAGDRFLKYQLALQVAQGELSRGDASLIEQTRQTDGVMGRFVRRVYPSYDDEFPARLHGKAAASMVEAVVGVVATSTLRDPETARRFWLSFDNRLEKMLEERNVVGPLVATPTSSTSSVVDV